MSEGKISQLAHDQGAKDKMVSACNLHMMMVTQMMMTQMMMTQMIIMIMTVMVMMTMME